MIPSLRANRTAASKVSFWRYARGLDPAGADERAEHRRVAVVAQAARVHRRRDEAVAERVHRHQRRHPDRVAEVVGVDAARERRAGGRLGGDDADVLAAGAQEREHEAGEVRAAADAADDHVGHPDAGELELGDRLLADHGLVQEDVVEHGAQRVVARGILCRHLDRLGDRDPERAGGVRGLRPARLGAVGGRAVHGRSPGLHHRAPVRLLVVARADHEHLALEPEERARERDRGAPLAGARLRGELA